MPWKEQRLETMREEFVKRVLQHEKTKSALCKEYGISRPTGDKWIERYLDDEPMKDQSRAPKSTPHRTPREIESMIVAYRKEHPAIGAVKIHRMLKNKGETMLPSSRTINAIFKRNGLITKEASQAATPLKRFEMTYPNEMWQADFKGDFRMNNGARCHPLNIVDDYSRYNLCCTPLPGETFAVVKPHMERLFHEYGLPFSFLCDNGNPWGTSQSTGYTRFEVWLMELGILTLHGRIQHPQTQGKDERFNGSFKRELLKYTQIEDLSDAEMKFAKYRDFYNNERPHHSLDLDVPASRYRTSPIKYPSEIVEWEYPTDCKLHAVKETGYITINGQGYYLSEAFGNKRIAVRESTKRHALLDLYFRKFRIGQIDVEKRVFTSKRAYLIEGDPRPHAPK